MSQSRKSSPNQSTSRMLTYLKATFHAPEKHPEAQPMSDFYKGIEGAIQLVREAILDADHDPAFKRAADIFSQLTPECQNMETMPPSKAATLMQNWIKQTKYIGKDGVIEVAGEASKLFAEKYIELFTKLIDKKIWPVPSPRTSTEYLPTWAPEVGPSFATVYPINFENGNQERMRKAIAIMQERIAEYEKSQSQAPSNDEACAPVQSFKI